MSGRREPPPTVTPFARLSIQAGCVSGTPFELLHCLRLHEIDGNLDCEILTSISTWDAVRLLEQCEVHILPGRRRELLDLKPREFRLSPHEWDTRWGCYVLQIADEATGEIEFQSRPCAAAVAASLVKTLQLPAGKTGRVAVLPGHDVPE